MRPERTLLRRFLRGLPGAVALLALAIPARAEGPVSIEWQLPAGRVFKYKSSRTLLDKGKSGVSTSSIEYAFSETVTAAPEGSPATISVQIDNVKVDLQQLKERVAWDSSKPKKPKKGDPLLVVAYAGLKGLKFDLKVDRLGELSETGPVDALQPGGTAIPVSVAAEILDLLRFQFSRQPDGPREPGDEWTFEFPLAIPPPEEGEREITEQVRCSLKGVEQKKGRPTATLTVTPTLGVTKFGGHMSVKLSGGGSQRSESKIVPSGSGNALWALDTGCLLSADRVSKVEATGDMMVLNVEVKRHTELVNKPEGTAGGGGERK